MNKTEATKAILQEKSLWDPAEKILYMPDISEYPYRMHGIQEFHCNISENEMKKSAESITDFCCGYIPAPGASGGNENGFACFTGFDMPNNDQDETKKEIKKELSWYLDQLKTNGTLQRLTIAE